MQTVSHGSPSFFATFSRSQLASLIASAADYGSLFMMTEIFHIWYVAATALGALIGAIVNFTVNRYWSFRAHQYDHWIDQAQRYAFVSAGSLALNTLGVYLVTEFAHLHYAGSVAIVSLMVGFFFNYPLHRYFVYRAKPGGGQNAQSESQN